MKLSILLPFVVTGCCASVITQSPNSEAPTKTLTKEYVVQSDSGLEIQAVPFVEVLEMIPLKKLRSESARTLRGPHFGYTGFYRPRPYYHHQYNNRRDTYYTRNPYYAYYSSNRYNPYRRSASYPVNRPRHSHSSYDHYGSHVGHAAILG